MRRREFITALGGAAVASAVSWPRTARAQQPAMPVNGSLTGGSPDGYSPMLAVFRQGLNETGYVEGQNVAIEYRWLEGQYERAPATAAELVRRQVAVIVANTPGNLAAKAATTTIPIVFSTGGDPVQMGLVASLGRPGGNVTGVTQMNQEVAPKRLELAHELVPTATTIALLVNRTSPNTESQVKDLQAAARKLGLQLHVLHAGIGRETLRPAGATGHQGRADHQHEDRQGTRHCRAAPAARPRRRGDRVRRRELITLVGGAAAMWQVAARGLQPELYGGHRVCAGPG